MPFTAHHLTELRMALGRSDMTQAECLAEIGRLKEIERKYFEILEYNHRRPMVIVKTEKKQNMLDWLGL